MTYIIIGVVVLIALIVIPSNTDSHHAYNAEFVPPQSVMSLFNHGFSLAGGLRATTKEIAYRGCLVVGQSGSGKSSTVLIGSIFSLARGNSSMCVMDPSAVLYELTSGWLRKQGYIIYCFDFGPTSDCYNFLANLKTVSEIEQIAQLLIRASGIESKNDPYWSSSGEMMLAVFIQYLVFHSPREYCTMANLARLLDIFAGSPDKCDLLFAKTHDVELLTKYKAMISVGDKTLQSTLSTVRTAIKVFGTPSLRDCTSTSTIDFSTFRKTKSILFICTPLKDIDFLAPASTLLYDELFKQILNRIPASTELSIFCLIDEMISVRFRNLGLVFSNCRKFRAGCMGLIQSEKMLEMNFSPAEAHAIKSNSYSLVYLPGQSLSACRELETILGKTTVIEGDKEKVRLLASASEIRMMDEAIILIGNKPPIKAKPISFYNHWLLSQRTKIAPYERVAKTGWTEYPLMDL